MYKWEESQLRVELKEPHGNSRSKTVFEIQNSLDFLKGDQIQQKKVTKLVNKSVHFTDSKGERKMS